MSPWLTVIDDAAARPGGGKQYRRVALCTAQDGAIQAAWPGAQGTLVAAAPPPSQAQRHRGPHAQAPSDAVTAPMAARVLAVHVEVGSTAMAGASLVVLEAMKMEHTVRAPQERLVAEVLVAPGEAVAHGQTLLTFAAQVPP